MRNEAEYFRGILDNLTGGFLSVDLSGAVVYGNPMAGRILHIPIGAILGKPFEAALSPYPALCEVIKDALHTGKIVRRAEVSVLHGDAQMTIGYGTLQVIGSGGERLGVGITFQDLTLVAKAKVA
jgi:PAS domain-containing protein